MVKKLSGISIVDSLNTNMQRYSLKREKSRKEGDIAGVILCYGMML